MSLHCTVIAIVESGGAIFEEVEFCEKLDVELALAECGKVLGVVLEDVPHLEQRVNDVIRLGYKMEAMICVFIDFCIYFVMFIMALTRF